MSTSTTSSMRSSAEPQPGPDGEVNWSREETAMRGPDSASTRCWRRRDSRQDTPPVHHRDEQGARAGVQRRRHGFTITSAGGRGRVYVEGTEALQAVVDWLMEAKENGDSRGDELAQRPSPIDAILALYAPTGESSAGGGSAGCGPSTAPERARGLRGSDLHRPRRRAAGDRRPVPRYRAGAPAAVRAGHQLPPGQGDRPVRQRPAPAPDADRHRGGAPALRPEGIRLRQPQPVRPAGEGGRQAQDRLDLRDPGGDGGRPCCPGEHQQLDRCAPEQQRRDQDAVQVLRLQVVRVGHPVRRGPRVRSHQDPVR